MTNPHESQMRQVKHRLLRDDRDLQYMILGSKWVMVLNILPTKYLYFYHDW